MKRIVATVSALIGILGSSFATAAETTLCINEIMQSNVDTYMLEHDFPDSWVELYNPTCADIDIYQYYIGASSSAARCYRFSNHATIKANGYLIIACDKVGSKLHTDFNLESDAGTLYLYNNSGTKIGTLSYPAMPAPNIAYGRSTDGGSTWGWEITPTPGKANEGNVSETILPAPVFSKAGQVMSASATITISLPSGNLPSDTKIYATTDGTEPTYSSTSGTKLTFDVSSTTVIRAKLLSKSAVARPSTTNSYIFHPRKTSLPIVSIVSNDDYFYSDAEGILSTSMTDGQENFKYDWRRPVNAEYLLSGEKAWFNQGGEVAVGGAVSRVLRQKTLKLYAKKRFGTKKLKGQFWNEKPKVTKVKSFALRNGGNSSSAMRFNDALLQRTFGTHLTNVDYQAYAPAIVYINGQYYGVVGLRERSNEDYVEANYNGLEDIEMGTDDSYKKTSTERKTSSFADVYKLYTSSTATYNQLADKIDVDNFMKVLMAEMYAANTDWPHNNIAMWRDKSTNGKWRWILKDLDFYILGENSKFNMFKYLFGPVSASDQEYETASRSKTKQAALLYKKMMSFPEFSETFIDTYTTYLGDFLKPSLNKATIDEFYSEIEEEIKPTFETFNYTYYPNHLDWMAYFTRSHMERSRYMYQHMADHFSLGTVIPMTLNPNGSPATINGIGLTTGSFDGAYFSKRELHLNAGSGEYGWKMVTYKNDGSKMVKNKEKSFAQSDVKILLSDYANCDSVAFTTYVANETDFTKKLTALGIKTGQPTDWSTKTAISIKEPQYAYANISGISALPTSKDSELHAFIDFYDNAGNYFRKKVLLNLQGNAENPKVNLAISFCEDDWIGEDTPDIKIGDWVSQDEFHLKAFYDDGMRGTAEIAYQLYGKITQRSNCYPKAFPLSLYVNGSYYGVMSWQIKKQRDNMGLDGKTATNVWLDGTLNDKQLFQGTINWAKFEVRNPKDLYNQDGTIYDGDNPQEIMGTNSSSYDSGTTKMVRTAQAKKYIQKLSGYCSELAALEKKGTSKSSMQTEIKKRFDTQELINYMVFSLVSNNYDGFSQNWQWFTYDGTKWTVAPYDCNLTFGYNEEGTSLWPATQSSKKYDYKMENVDSSGPMYWIKNYFWDEVKSRYAELRKNGTISTNSIMTLVDNWHNRIGNANYKEEWAKWKSSPCVKSFTDSPDRFRDWIDYRIALEDAYLGYSSSSVSYTFVVSSSEWATLCVPFSFSIPAGMKVYTIKSVHADGVNLVLEETTNPLANKPYLINSDAGAYTISGEVTASTGPLTNGLLTGTLINTYVPANSYVLQNLNNIVGFYHVSTDDTMPIEAYHAYLSTDATSSLGHFRIPDDVDGISTILSEEDGESTMYNIWGQQSDSDNNAGLFIQRSPDGSRRKIYIQK